MSTSNDIQEFFLNIPWETADKCNGFGLDFGGSVCKLIYIHKDDWQEPGNRTQATARLRCVSFARVKFDDALAYLKERVMIRRASPDEKPVIYTTGIGGSQYSIKIRETFNIQAKNITELECFIAGFNYIVQNVTRGELIHELNEGVVKKVIDKNRKLEEVMKAMMKDSANCDMPESQENLGPHPQELPLQGEKKLTDYDHLFPCFLVMIGSNGGIFVIKEDGTYTFANDIRIAGRAFLGLGSVLTGAKSYEELMALAEKGSMQAVHEYAGDMTAEIDSKEDNFYSHIKDLEDDVSDPGFLFGKCVFKESGDFKREDLAMSLLWSTVDNMVQQAHLPLRFYPNVHHVFFCGGFPSHPMTRDLMTERWISRECVTKNFIKLDHYSHSHFLKHGQHLGALGAFLNQMLHFVKPADNPQQ